MRGGFDKIQNFRKVLKMNEYEYRTQVQFTLNHSLTEFPVAFVSVRISILANLNSQPILQNSVMNPPSFDLSILLRVNTASRHAIRALLACSDLQSLLNLNSTYRRIIPILVRTLSFKATIR